MAQALESAAEAEIAAYKELQGHISTLMSSRGRFLQQKSENEMVKGELELAKEDNAVYKLVGPVLFKQEMDDVKENVTKRLESARPRLRVVVAPAAALPRSTRDAPRRAGSSAGRSTRSTPRSRPNRRSRRSSARRS